MALRDVTVEVRATFIVKVKANNGKEAMKKAEDFVIYNALPDYIDDVTILEVEHLKE